MTHDRTPLRFLVVDDDDDIREVLVRLVERLGHVTHQARDGAEAVEALAVHTYDVMLLDLTMPRMSGEDVLLWLRHHPEWAEDLRVIVVSARAGAGGGSQTDGLRARGAHAVLAKPLRIEDLRHLIEPLSATVARRTPAV